MSTVPIDSFLVLASILLTISTFGVLTRRCALVVQMSVQFMLHAASLTFLAFSRLHGDSQGHAMVCLAMAIAVVELGVGIATIFNVFRQTRSVNIDEIRVLRP